MKKKSKERGKMSTEGLHEFGEESRKLYISYTTNDRKKKGGKGYS